MEGKNFEADSITKWNGLFSPLNGTLNSIETNCSIKTELQHAQLQKG